MTCDGLCEVLAVQTLASSPAWEALLSGGAFAVWEGLAPANRLFHTYRIRGGSHKGTGRRSSASMKAVGIHQATGEEPLLWLDQDGRSGKDVTLSPCSPPGNTYRSLTDPANRQRTTALRRRLLQLSVQVWWHPYWQQAGTGQRAALRSSARELEPGTW